MFAAIAAEESMRFINTGTLLNLSEQNILDCDLYDEGCTAGSCEGAYLFVLIEQDGHFSTEEDYPYTGVDFGICRFVQCPARLDDFATPSSPTEESVRAFPIRSQQHPFRG